MKEIRTYSLLISWGFIATFELALICHLLCNLDLIFPKQDQFANLSDHSHPSSADKNHEHKPDTHHLIDFEVNMSHQYYSLNVAEECCDDLSRALYSSLFLNGAEKITFNKVYSRTITSFENLDLLSNSALGISKNSSIEYNRPPPMSGVSIRIYLHSFLN